MFLISRWIIKSSFQQDRLQYKKEEVELERRRWGMNCLKPDESWRKWWEGNLFFSAHTRASNRSHCSDWGVKLVQISLVQSFSLLHYLCQSFSPGSVLQDDRGRFQRERQTGSCSLHGNATEKQRWRGYFRHLGLQLHVKWIIIIRTDKGRWLTAGRLSRPKYV